VGSPYYDLSGVIDRGQVRVYDFSTNSLWVPRGSNIMVGEGSNDYSGMSMSMSEDGKVVAIGAPFNDGSGNLTDSGHVRVYAWDGSAWAQRGADIDGGVTTTTTPMQLLDPMSGSKDWYSVSMSSTGQYQSAVVYDGNIWTSYNHGITWTARESVRYWAGLSLSSSGQYQTAAVTNGFVYVSQDFGISWIQKDAARNRQGDRCISLSSTGQYQTATECNGGQLWISNDYGQTWSAKQSGRLWYAVSLSSSGQYQSAAVINDNIYVSSDYGMRWTSKEQGRVWVGISLSSTGQYQTAVVQGGLIYISSDFGERWDSKDTVQTWRSVSLSSTGQYQTVVGQNVKIMVSSDFGGTWTPKDSARTWNSISISSTGQYQSAYDSPRLIYFSRDYGDTWSQYASYSYDFTNINTEGDQAGTSVSLSADGSVVAVGSPYYDISGGTNIGQMRVFSWSGSTWMPRGNAIIGKSMGDRSGWSANMSADGTVMAIGAPFSDGSGNAIDSGHVRVYGWNGVDWIKRGDDIEGEVGVLSPPRVVSATGDIGSKNWYSVSMSSTGQYQSAVVNGGNIWTSSDYGVNWTERTTGATRGWMSISSSSTGQYQTAMVWNGNIWTSSNFGVNWVDRTTGTTAVNKNWRSVSLSSTGQYQTAVATYNNIWVSSDFGVNWVDRTTGTTAENNNWYSVSISSTGQYQTAVVTSSGNIWVSSNFGVNWVDRTTGTTGANKDWYSVSLSSTGQYQTALWFGASGNIWGSSNFGVTWNDRTTGTTAANKTWLSVSISSTGQYQTAVVNGNGNIWVSSDFGVTWVDRTTGTTAANKVWLYVSLSSTGQYQSAIVSTGLIYFSRDYGFTWKSTAEYEVVTGGDQSGFSVSLSANGNTVAVGAPYNDVDVSGGDRGHVRVYDWNAGTSKWNQRGVMDIDGEAYADLAGWSVSLSADGSTVAFGAPMNERGEVHSLVAHAGRGHECGQSCSRRRSFGPVVREVRRRELAAHAKDRSPSLAVTFHTGALGRLATGDGIKCAVNKQRNHRKDRHRDHDLEDRHRAFRTARADHLPPPSGIGWPLLPEPETPPGAAAPPAPPAAAAAAAPPAPNVPAAMDGFVTNCTSLKSRSVGPSFQFTSTVTRRTLFERMGRSDG